MLKIVFGCAGEGGIRMLKEASGYTWRVSEYKKGAFRYTAIENQEQQRTEAFKLDKTTPKLEITLGNQTQRHLEWFIDDTWKNHWEKTWILAETQKHETGIKKGIRMLKEASGCLHLLDPETIRTETLQN